MATPTMQTPISPLLPATSAPSTASTKAATATPPYQFQQTLSRQIEQRQVTSRLDQAQTRSRIEAQAKAQASADAKAAQPDQPTAPATESNAAADAKADTKAESSADAPVKADDGRTDQNTNVAPSAINDMLTLVASLQQGASSTRTAALTPTERQLSADGAGGADGAGRGRAATLSGARAASLSAATDALDAGAAKIAATEIAATDVDADNANPDSFNAAKIKADVALTTLSGKTAGPDLNATLNQVTPLHQAAQQIAQTAQSASVAAPEQLPGRVGSPAWDQQLGQKVVWMVAGGVQSASLTLNPPDLGPLQVVLSISNDEAIASFTSAQPEVRQALEAALPKLREMMSEAGINLGNASVSGGMSDQSQSADQGQRMNERSNLRGTVGGDSDESAHRHGTTSVQASTARGMVDTFA
jgi:flagellar hook-length control protein FliK